MTKEREALKLALEALELSHPRFGIGTAIYIKAITAIKEALAQPEQAPMNYYRADAKGNLKRIDIHSAQPEQEPVAWIWEKEDGYTSIETHSLDDEDMKNVGVKSIKPLYTTPSQRKPLTDEEIYKASTEAGMQEHYMGFHSGFIRFARAIEAEHGIKGDA